VSVKRVLWLLLVAGIAVWGVALIDFGHRAPSASSGPGGATSAGSPSTVAEAASRAASSGRSDEEPADDQGSVAPSRGRSGKEAAATGRPAGQGTVQVVGKAVGSGTGKARGSATAQADELEATPSPALGEIGSGATSKEFAALEQHYVEEVRDGAWALGEEQRVRALLRDQSLDGTVALVHCQETTCRMVLDGASPSAFERLLQVPGLSQETALSLESPYSLRSGQLAVYFRRADVQAQAKAP
jgi:hypothetical protein